MNRLALLAATALCAAALLATGCGGSSSGGSSPAKAVDPNGPEVSPAGDIPDDQAFVAYAPAGAGFSVKVPEGWGRRTAAGATTFTDKLNSITVARRPAAGRQPTAASARATEIPRLAKRVKGFAGARASTVTRSAGPAVLITYLADSAPDAVTGKARRDAVERYEFFHDGKRVVLTLSGPKGADNVDPWKIVTDSLRWTR
jgi:hypothetical protein